MLVAAICAVPGAGFATDKVEARTVAMPSQIAAASFAAEDVAISINAGPEEIWSGTLRIGGPSGSANFSLSKNEFARPCPDDPDAASRQTMSSLRVNFNMSRRNWNQEPDKFNVNVNWTRPLSACQGEGSDRFGFNRVVDLPQGQMVSVEGAGGLVLRLTRGG
jgi:hypothetical protein